MRPWQWSLLCSERRSSSCKGGSSRGKTEPLNVFFLTNSESKNKTVVWYFKVSKIKGWCRTGDIRVKKPKKIFKCWVKDKTKVPLGEQDDIITVLQSPNHKFGKDEYLVDMTGPETHYWQGTESGLLGAFEFQGACTVGDGSCDTGSKSMGTDFCNFILLGWNTQIFFLCDLLPLKSFYGPNY
jgi:hypothetical protein